MIVIIPRREGGPESEYDVALGLWHNVNPCREPNARLWFHSRIRAGKKQADEQI
jgi:hypothetical protein